MKAHINGITIEGTPEEIAAYQRIKAEEARQKSLPPTPREPLVVYGRKIDAKENGYERYILSLTDEQQPKRTLYEKWMPPVQQNSGS